MALQWDKLGDGDWFLYDKPRGVFRHPIAAISGCIALGFLASLSGQGGEAIGKFRSVRSAKAAIENALSPTV